MNDIIKGVVVDAGHGGDDPGAVSGNLKEKDFNLRAAQYMYERLRELGIPATLTRNDDETITPDERVKRILDAYGDFSNVIVISNHMNAGNGEGAEIIYALRNNSTLARNALNGIGKEGQIMRKYYQRRLPENPMQDYYFIHRNTGSTQPLLIEYGFIDNPNDQKKLENDLLKYVEGVVQAIANYGGYKYTPPTGMETEFYTVRKNDSLWSIATMFGLSIQELKEINNLKSDVLEIGQLLKVTNNTTNLPNVDNNPITKYYIVQKNDSLWSIAKKFNTSVENLIAINKLNSLDLQIGQKILLSSNSSDSPNDTENNLKTYIVISGDSLYSIAKRFNITVDMLKQDNNLTSNTLQIGQKLNVPNNSTSTNKNYVVKRNDSLWTIARNNNTTVNTLKSINNLTDDNLSVGQILLLP